MDSEKLNDTLEKLYKSAEASSAEGLTEEAIKKCEAALEILDIHFDEALSYTHSDFLMLGGHAHWEASNIVSAQQFYRQAFEMEYGRMDAAVAMAVSLFHLAAFYSCRYHLELVCVENPDVAEAWYYRGLLAQRDGNDRLAKHFYHKAHELEPNRWHRPKSLLEKEIVGLIKNLIKQLPEQFQVECGELEITFRDLPEEELIHEFDPPLDPLSIVLFEGTSRFEEDTFGVKDKTNHLTVFTKNLELIAGDPEKLRGEIEQTVVEEFARFLGVDTDKLLPEDE